MWARDYSVTTDLPAERVWERLVDVAGWQRWNDGIELLTLHGPVAVGTTFDMKPPGEDVVTSTIIGLEPGRCLVDLTELDGVAVRVEHRLDPVPGVGTEIRYRVEVSGAVPDEVAQEIGVAVSADFPDVLAALVADARRGGR